jgi:hypothetical protein
LQQFKTKEYKDTRKRYKKSEKGNLAEKHYSQSEKFKIKQKRYNQSKKGKAKAKRYRQSEKGKVAHKRYWFSHPEELKRHKARQFITNAVSAGRLPRPDSIQCSCGEQAVQYHHYKGYEPDHWLDVVPVCRKCHAILHGQAPNLAPAVGCMPISMPPSSKD